MDDFLGQFLAQVWGFVLFLLGLIAAYISLLFYLRQRRNRIQNEKKAAVMGETPVKEKAKAEKVKAAPADDWVAPVAEAPIMLDDDDDDPLAELYAVRAEEAQQELSKPRPPLQKSPTPVAKPAPKVEDDEVVDLASLLAGMAGEEKDYHHVSTTPVLVKREDGAMTSAKELLSIQRDESDTRLLVQIGELGYRSLLNNASAKTNFTKTMKELSGVILAADTPPAAPENPEGEAHSIGKEVLNIKLDNGREATSRELFTILRDDADGHLMIQIGEVAYRTLQQNEQAKTAFTKVMKELSTVVLTPDTAPAPIAEAEPYIEEEESNSAAVNNLIPSDLPPGVLRMKKMDELGPTHTVGRFGQVRPSKEKIEVPEVNIAEAIEAFLQYKISQNPDFQKRGIHVRPTPAGGVRIEAEGKTYEAVDEVANPEIRAFIKQAIAEWQDHH